VISTCNVAEFAPLLKPRGSWHCPALGLIDSRLAKQRVRTASQKVSISCWLEKSTMDVPSQSHAAQEWTEPVFRVDAKEGRNYAAIEARSMILGAVAFFIYACIACRFLIRGKWSALRVTVTALSVWCVSAFGLWLVLLR
jgi:hypothetical protein